MRILRSGGRRGVLTAAATACALTGTALLALAFAPGTEPPPLPEAAVRAPGGEAGALPEPPAGTTPRPGPAAELPPSPPTRIAVPAIGLQAEVVKVGLNDAGAVAMPRDTDHAGWYGGSPAPGRSGNSVLVGHVDSRTGPAAFYGLGAVEDGDEIRVRREDGRTAVYVVDGMSVWPKDAFPSERVYGPTRGPRLTLLTCADWDDEQETYLSNLVVTAHLESPQGSSAPEGE